jgi:hypothetical protein
MSVLKFTPNGKSVQVSKSGKVVATLHWRGQWGLIRVVGRLSMADLANVRDYARKGACAN